MLIVFFWEYISIFLGFIFRILVRILYQCLCLVIILLLQIYNSSWLVKIWNPMQVYCMICKCAWDFDCDLFSHRWCVDIYSEHLISDSFLWLVKLFAKIVEFLCFDRLCYWLIFVWYFPLIISFQYFTAF